MVPVARNDVSLEFEGHHMNISSCVFYQWTDQLENASHKQKQ